MDCQVSIMSSCLVTFPDKNLMLNSVKIPFKKKNNLDQRNDAEIEFSHIASLFCAQTASRHTTVNNALQSKEIKHYVDGRIISKNR